MLNDWRGLVAMDKVRENVGLLEGMNSGQWLGIALLRVVGKVAWG